MSRGWLLELTSLQTAKFFRLVRPAKPIENSRWSLDFGLHFVGCDGFSKCWVLSHRHFSHLTKVPRLDSECPRLNEPSRGSHLGRGSTRSGSTRSRPAQRAATAPYRVSIGSPKATVAQVAPRCSPPATASARRSSLFLL